MVRRLTAIVVAAAVTATMGAADADAHIVAQVGNSAVFASVATDGSLNYYWQGIDSPAWSQPQQVAGPGSTEVIGQPAIAQIAKATGIAAESPSGAITYYAQAIGAKVWAPLPIGDAGSATGQPSLAQVGSSAVIAVLGPSAGLDFYYLPSGGQTWSQPQTVSGAGSASPAGPYGTPSITQVGDDSVITAQGPNASLWVFWQQIGTRPWHSNEIANANTTYTQPTISALGNSAAIAAGGTNKMYVYTQSLPLSSAKWTSEPIYTTPNGAHTTTIAQVGNTMVLAYYIDSISSNGEGSTALWCYSQTIGSANGAAVPVTAPGPAPGGTEPDIADVGGAPVIGVALSNGGGLFYWRNSSGTWKPETI